MKPKGSHVNPTLEPGLPLLVVCEAGVAKQAVFAEYTVRDDVRDLWLKVRFPRGSIEPENQVRN